MIRCKKYLSLSLSFALALSFSHSQIDTHLKRLQKILRHFRFILDARLSQVCDLPHPSESNVLVWIMDHACLLAHTRYIGHTCVSNGQHQMHS